MFIAYAIVTIFLALAVTASAAGKLQRAPRIVTMMAELNVPGSWLPWLAAAEIAGAVGLLIGFALPALGIAAAAGLVGYFVGAVFTHVRLKRFDIGPAAFLTLVALAATILRILTL
ncbi:MAG: DoxX family protein [Actinomycetota bacterium]